jgi:WD40 repeat protein
MASKLHSAPSLGHTCRWHVFLSHAQATGGLQCLLLREALEAACPALRVWFDQVCDQLALVPSSYLSPSSFQDEEATEAGMANGVAGSTTFLLFLSRSVLQRPFCQAELVAAVAAGKPLILLHDSDATHGGAPLDDLLSEGDDVALVSDPAFHGGGHGFCTSHMAALRAAISTGRVFPFVRGRAFEAETIMPLLQALKCSPNATAVPAALYRLRRRTLPMPEGAHVCLLSSIEGYDQCSHLARALMRLCPRLVARCLHDWNAEAEEIVNACTGAVIVLTARVWQDARVSTVAAALQTARRPVRLLHEADPRHGGAVAFGDILQATPGELRSLYASAIAEVLERRRDKRALMLDNLLRSNAVGALRESDASAAGLRASPPPLPWSFRREPVEGYLIRAANLLTIPNGPAVLALGGAGGAGKSAVAAALVRESNVRATYDDTLWLTLGRAAAAPAVLLSKLADALAAAADGDDDASKVVDLGSATADVPSAAAALAVLLARRPLILVADDAPQDSGAMRALLDALPADGPSRLVITTRDIGAIERAASRGGRVRGAPFGFEAMQLPQLSPTAAAAMLADVAGISDLEGPPLHELATMAGATPLSLGLVGGALRTHVEKPGYSAPSAAAAAAVEALALADTLATAALPHNLTESPALATFRAIDTALRASFASADLDKYILLGALPPKAIAPFPVLAAAWRMSYERCDALIRAFQAAALLKYDVTGDVWAGVVSLHDLHAEFAAAVLTARGITAAAHAHILDRARIAAGMEDDVTAWAATGGPTGGMQESMAIKAGAIASQSYVWDHAPFHLAHAGRPNDAVSLLVRLDFLQGSLVRRGITALLAHLSAPWASADEECRLLAAALRLSSVLRTGTGSGAQVAAALPAQLVGRLCAFGPPRHPRLGILVSIALSTRSGEPALMPRTSSLAPPGAAEEAVMTGHAGRITALASLPDGRLLSASVDGSLRVWSAPDASCLAVMEGHSTCVEAITYWIDAADCDSTASLRIASIASDGEFRVWNGVDCASEGLPLRVNPLPLGDRSTALVAFRASSVVLFVGDAAGAVAAGTLTRHAASDWTVRWSLPYQLESMYENEPPGVLCALACEGISAEDTSRTIVVTGHRADAVAVWTVNLGPNQDSVATPSPVVSLLRRLYGHTGWVSCARLTPAGALLTCSWDRTLRLWGRDTLSVVDVSHSTQPRVERVYADAAPLWRRVRGATSTTALADGSSALVGYQNGQIASWPLSHTYVPGAGPTRLLQAGVTAVTALAALPDGRAASGGADGLVRVWGLLSHEAPRPHNGEVTAAARVGPHLMMTIGADGALCVWDSRSGKARLQARRTGSHFACLQAGESANLQSEDGVCEAVFVGDWAGICIRRIALRTLLREHGNGSEPQSSTGTAASIELPSRLVSRVVPIMTCGRPAALASLPRGRLAGGGWHNHINVWDAARLTAPSTDDVDKWSDAESTLDEARGRDVIVAELKGHTDHVTTLLALPWRAGGDSLLSGSRDTTLRLWEAAAPGNESTWICVAVLRSHNQPVTALVALPSMQRAVSASEDGTVCIWSVGADMVLDAPLVRSRPMGSPLLSLSLADSQTTATFRSLYASGSVPAAIWAGSVDGVIYLLDAATARPLIRDAGVADAAPIRALAVAEDKTLLAGTARGEVHTYVLQ